MIQVFALITASEESACIFTDHAQMRMEMIDHYA